MSMDFQEGQAGLLAWAGCNNARDVGGSPTTSGGRVRRRVLIRSDSLHNLTSEGMAALYDYGVRTIIDLRLAHELREYPSPYATHQTANPAPSYLNLPIHDLETGALVDQAQSTVAVYTLILERHKDLIASILNAVADGIEEGGVLIQCHSGKDRTGIIVALLLSAAGVGPEAIAQDYALSEVMLEPRYQVWVQEHLRLHGKIPEKPWQAQTRPETMYAMLDYLDLQYGGAKGYLLAAGVEADVLEHIRDRITEPIAVEEG